MKVDAVSPTLYSKITSKADNNTSERISTAYAKDCMLKCMCLNSFWTSLVYANKLYRRPANQYESDSSMTNEVHDTNLMLLVVWFKEVGNLSFITFVQTKSWPMSQKVYILMHYVYLSWTSFPCFTYKRMFFNIQSKLLFCLVFGDIN